MSSVDSPSEKPGPNEYMLGLAELLNSEIVGGLDGKDPDEAFRNVRELTPAFYIARAAMTLTGEDSPLAAVTALYDDEDIKKKLLEQVAVIDDITTETGIIAELLPKRVEKLRDHAEDGSLKVKHLKKGEVISLLYKETSGDKVAILEVARYDEGNEDGNLGLIIRGANGKTLKDRGDKLRTGQTGFLGFKPAEDSFEAELVLKAPPAWVRSLTQHEGEWMCDGSILTDTDYALQQAYYGPTNQYPLFPEVTPSELLL